jgi:hypothetical protein
MGESFARFRLKLRELLGHVPISIVLPGVVSCSTRYPAVRTVSEKRRAASLVALWQPFFFGIPLHCAFSDISRKNVGRERTTKLVAA